MRRGRLNQKRSSPGWTSGVPLTTPPLSWILKPILVIMTCSFVPTSKIIYRSTISAIRWVCWTVQQSKYVKWTKMMLTISGRKGSHRKEYQPVNSKNKNKRRRRRGWWRLTFFWGVKMSRAIWTYVIYIGDIR